MSMPPAAAASGLPPPQQPQQPPPQAQAIAMGERFGQGQQGALPPAGSGGQVCVGVGVCVQRRWVLGHGVDLCVVGGAWDWVEHS